MLRSIQLENFKAFGKRAVIPLAPITLIFGQNSAGKSSILQSLNLLKQTVESESKGAVLQLRAENGLVDLGSFQDLLFRHDQQRDLMIRLDMDARDYKGPHKALLVSQPHSQLGIEWRFARPSVTEEIVIQQFSLFADGEENKLASFVNAGTTLHPRTSLRRFSEVDLDEGPLVTAMRFNELTTDVRYWQKTYTSVRDNINVVLSTIEDGKSKLESHLDRVAEGDDDDDDNYFVEPWIETLLAIPDPSCFDEALRFYKSDFTLEEFAKRISSSRIGTTFSLPGLFVGLNVAGKEPTVDEYLFSCLADYGNETLEYGCSGWGMARQAKELTEFTLRKLFPLGPFRKPAERMYIFNGNSPQNVGMRGQFLPDLLIRNAHLVGDTNEWLRRLEIGYEIEVRTFGPTLNDYFEIRLKDIKQTPPVDVGLLDVGFGVSQILPLIVQSLAASGQIVTVEQPEVHIHPRLQADLGDLLIAAIQEPRRNQFIIETHSEHLALRLQRRVREKVLSPNDISIVFVSRGPDGATVQPLRLDEDGDFMDDFPGGFFPERLRELR